MLHHLSRRSKASLYYWTKISMSQSQIYFENDCQSVSQSVLVLSPSSGTRDQILVVQVIFFIRHGLHCKHFEK